MATDAHAHPCAGRCASAAPCTAAVLRLVLLLQKSSKVLADAMEALLGAFLVAGGHSAALAFLQVSLGFNALLETVWNSRAAGLPAVLTWRGGAV